MNSLSFSEINIESPFCSWIYHKFIIFFAKSLWMLSEITINSLSFSRIYSEFTVFENSLPVSRIDHLFRGFNMNSLLFPRIFYEFIFGFAFPLWIHFLLREYSMNSFSVACIHYPSREYIMNSQSISQFTIDRVSFPRIHYEITLNSLSITLIHY